MASAACRISSGLLGVAFLEEEPALQYSHDRRHRRVAEFRGQISALDRKRQGLIVLSLHAQAAALPEIGDRQQFLIVDLRLETQDKIKVPNGLVL